MLDDEYFMNPVFPCSLNSLEESQNANIRNNRIACNKYNNKNMKKAKDPVYWLIIHFRLSSFAAFDVVED